MTQVRPNKMLNKMNGDNLTQLKYLKKAEVSSRVLSFNMASKAELLKKVKFGFREQRLNVDKINKGQTLVYRDLCRLQQNKRKLLRETHVYKQEDAKLEQERIQREERIDQILREYDQKSQELLDSLLRRKKRKRPKSSDSVESHKSSDHKNEDTEQQQHMETPDETNENQDLRDRHFSTEDPSHSSTTEQPTDHTTEPKRTERRRTSKTLAVSVGESPKILVRSESQEEIELRQNRKQSTKSPEPAKSPEQLKLPPINGATREDETIDAVSRVNVKTYRLSIDHPGRQRLPSIFENGDMDETERPVQERKPPSPTPPPLQKSPLAPNSTSSCSSHSDNNKKVDNKEYMKRLQKRREMENRRILDQPYEIYTENEKGQIVPMISPPKPFSTELPSNRRQYDQHKMLETQYRYNALQGLKLKSFYAKLEKPDSPEFPILARPKEPTKEELKKKTPPSMANPMAAMAALLPSHMMDESEQPAYVRQLDFDEMREARKRGRRSSSWAHALV